MTQQVQRLADRVLAAAIMCGLTRRQAADLLAETLAVSRAAALKPSRRAQLLSDLHQRTVNIVSTASRPRRARLAAALATEERKLSVLGWQQRAVRHRPRPIEAAAPREPMRRADLVGDVSRRTATKVKAVTGRRLGRKRAAAARTLGRGCEGAS